MSTPNTSTARGGAGASALAGDAPFLIGEAMTGGYGKGPDILHACTIAVNPGEIAVIVGPNGAGKSTAMKAVFGMLDLREGHVRLDGEDITYLSPQERVRKGMGFVPQTSNIFTSMTVEENLEMGAFIRTDDIRETIEQVFDLFPILRDKRRQPAGELSGGQRQQVAVGRALMTKPKSLDVGRTHSRCQPHCDGRIIRPYYRGQPHRPAHFDGGTKRPPSAGNRRQRLCAGARCQCLYRHRARFAE
jgi:branched-chain amino acid transport system ATP-binding protein